MIPTVRTPLDAARSLRGPHTGVSGAARTDTASWLVLYHVQGDENGMRRSISKLRARGGPTAGTDGGADRMVNQELVVRPSAGAHPSDCPATPDSAIGGA